MVLQYFKHFYKLCRLEPASRKRNQLTESNRNAVVRERQVKGPVSEVAIWKKTGPERILVVHASFANDIGSNCWSSIVGLNSFDDHKIQRRLRTSGNTWLVASLLLAVCSCPAFSAPKPPRGTRRPNMVFGTTTMIQSAISPTLTTTQALVEM